MLEKIWEMLHHALIYFYCYIELITPMIHAYIICTPCCIIVGMSQNVLYKQDLGDNAEFIMSENICKLIKSREFNVNPLIHHMPFAAVQDLFLHLI